ncbi:MAG: hypothetical protein U0R19_38280 [Bryobacteraceae bacterium]
MPRKPNPPDEQIIDLGTKHRYCIDRGGDGHEGVILDEQGEIRSRFGRRCQRPFPSLRNPFMKRDFVVINESEDSELIIRRSSFLPPVFDILDQFTLIGSIRLTSPLRNRYQIAICGENSWTFRKHLFSVLFSGVSTASTDIWVFADPSWMEWNVLIRPGQASQILLAALAFLHTEFWNYT